MNSSLNALIAAIRTTTGNSGKTPIKSFKEGKEENNKNISVPIVKTTAKILPILVQGFGDFNPISFQGSTFALISPIIK